MSDDWDINDVNRLMRRPEVKSAIEVLNALDEQLDEIEALEAQRDRLQAENEVLRAASAPALRELDAANAEVARQSAELDRLHAEHQRHRALYVEAVKERDRLQGELDGLAALIDGSIRTVLRVADETGNGNDPGVARLRAAIEPEGGT